MQIKLEFCWKMDRLPSDCICEISRHLTVLDICSLAKCNSNFAKWCLSSCIWKCQASKHQLGIPYNKISFKTYKEHHLIPVYNLHKEYFTNIFHPIGFLRHSELGEDTLHKIRMFSDSVLCITDKEQRYVATYIITSTQTYENIFHYQAFLETKPLIAWLYTLKKCEYVTKSLIKIQSIMDIGIRRDKLLRKFWNEFWHFQFVKGPDFTYTPKLKTYFNLPILGTCNIQIPDSGPIRKYIFEKIRLGWSLWSSYQYIKKTKQKTHETRWIVTLINSIQTVKIKKIKE